MVRTAIYGRTAVTINQKFWLHPLVTVKVYIIIYTFFVYILMNIVVYFCHYRQYFKLLSAGTNKENPLSVNYQKIEHKMFMPSDLYIN